jgi:hypothetical protein
MATTLPLELVNKILIMRPTHPSATAMQHILGFFDDFYASDYDEEDPFAFWFFRYGLETIQELGRLAAEEDY